MKNKLGYDDSASSVDLFSIDAYTKGLAKFIKNCNTPMTIAIQGNWGSGKTSMMERLKYEIGDSADCHMINTWQYSQFDLGSKLPLFFLTCILNALTNNSFENKKDSAGVLKGALFSLANFSAQFIPVVGDVASGVVQDVEKRVNARLDSPINAINTIKKNFQIEVDKKIKEVKKDRLVFFIDDLDRLEPQKAVELMEIMKVLLECRNCVFILAIDYEVVVRGIKDKYGNDIDDRKARNFFDKIIQVPFSLPVGKYNIEQYIENLINGNNDTAPCGLEKADISTITDLIQNSVGCNPRAIKRVINSYILLREISTIEHATSQYDYNVNNLEIILFASLCMQLAYDKMYEVLLANCNDLESTNKFFNSIIKLDDEEYLKKYDYYKYSEVERRNISEFMDSFLTCVNASVKLNKKIFDNDTNDESTDQNNENLLISKEAHKLLKEALKSSSSTSVVTNSTTVSDYDKMPAKFRYIYEVLELLNKNDVINADENKIKMLISDAKNIVAKEHGVTQSAITDKTARQLGIDAQEFSKLTKDFFEGGHRLIELMKNKNKDQKLENDLVKKFEELQASK